MLCVKLCYILCVTHNIKCVVCFFVAYSAIQGEVSATPRKEKQKNEDGSGGGDGRERSSPAPPWCGLASACRRAPSLPNLSAWPGSCPSRRCPSEEEACPRKEQLPGHAPSRRAVACLVAEVECPE